jgi:hypothetical protein
VQGGSGSCTARVWFGPTRTPRPSQSWSASRCNPARARRYAGQGSRVTCRCPIGARPVPPHLGQTGACLVSRSSELATTITPVPRQAPHSSSSALCFGFFGCMSLFGIVACWTDTDGQSRESVFTTFLILRELIRKEGRKRKNKKGKSVSSPLFFDSRLCGRFGRPSAPPSVIPSHPVSPAPGLTGMRSWMQ